MSPHGYVNWFLTKVQKQANGEKMTFPAMVPGQSPEPSPNKDSIGFWHMSSHWKGLQTWMKPMGNKYRRKSPELRARQGILRLTPKSTPLVGRTHNLELIKMKNLWFVKHGSAGKESACNVRDLGLIPGLGWSPEEGNGFLHGEFHGQRSLVGYSSWGHKESDTTERLTHTHTHTHTQSAGALGIQAGSPEEEFDTEVRLCHIVKPLMLMLTEKKNIMWELWVKFYLEQNKDYSLA